VRGTTGDVHTRTESVAERIDQLCYDLLHAEGLAGFGVLVDRSAAAAELERLSRDDKNATLTHVYDRARLDTLRKRQDYAMAQVKRTGAVIEVCPTSNRRIGGIADAQHHPVHRFLAAGLRVVVASDDPGIFGTTLAQELAWVQQNAGLSDEEQRQLLRNAWQYRSEVLTGRERLAGDSGR
jgi:cytosine/adenosine deaminase-related metal-dependent hydrolase